MICSIVVLLGNLRLTFSLALLTASRCFILQAHPLEGDVHRY